jgi:hypothetical protein
MQQHDDMNAAPFMYSVPENCVNHEVTSSQEANILRFTGECDEACTNAAAHIPEDNAASCMLDLKS